MNKFSPRLDTDSLKSNIRYEELQNLKLENLSEWAETLRLELKHNWEENNIPPQVGKNKDKIISGFAQLKDYPLEKLWFNDESQRYNYQFGVIKNFTKLGSSCNQFFPHMLKSRVRGYSIYDFLTDERLFSEFRQRMIKRTRFDSMYLYSKYLENSSLVSGVDYLIQWFRDNRDKYNYFLEPLKSNDPDVLYGKVYVDSNDIKYLRNEGILKDYHLGNVLDTSARGYKYGFLVREYKKSKRIFPSIIQILRLGLGQVPVNFNPLTARLIYNQFLEKTESEQIVCDFSAGWGGRLLGSLCSNRKIKYVGTDVNSKNVGCYENLAEFYNTNCGGTNKYEMFYEGSEVIQHNPKFQQYRGKLDLCFTSPPYFGRELYSEDDAQSVIKFPIYKDWREGFLNKTIQNSFEYLKNNRYMLINISNVKIQGCEFIPLVEDTISSAVRNGFEYLGDIGMVMTRNLGMDVKDTENSWYDLDSGVLFKTEPILVFLKK